MKMDKYQQAYIDHNLTPKSVTRLVANSGCVDFNTVITIRTNDVEMSIPISCLFGIDISKVEIKTPDGWQPIDDVFITGEKPSFLIETNTKSVTVSEDHLLLKDTNIWAHTCSMSISDKIQTVDGIETIKNITSVGIIPTMDITVGHPNHRYYTNGIVSHNSGKTSTISVKIANLLRSGVKQEEIFAIAFNNKSAFELKNKIKSLSSITLPYVSTMHSFSISLLKMNDVKPIVMNEWQSVLSIRKILETNNLTIGSKKDDTQLSRDLLNKFNYIRANLYNVIIEDFETTSHFQDLTINEDQFKQLYVSYHEFKVSKNLWDFQDLISPRAEFLIKNIPAFKYAFIDESQDLDTSIYRMIFNLFSGCATTLVGDIKQKLYCIDPETKITILNNDVEKEISMSESKFLPIDGSVKVMSRHGWATFNGYIPKGLKKIITIHFSDGTFLKCTPDHLIETSQGWVKANELSEEHEIL